jgi:ubiquinone/menaquinone biosynthesis C-methylase UbiE
MPKHGEMTFLGKIGELGLLHALGKPFSDPDRHELIGEIATVLRLLPKPPCRLMDMGCGTGWTSAWFARSGYDVLGIDISQEMIDAAEESASAEGLGNLRFLTCDYENLDIENEFDCAVFCHSLHHAEDETAALRSVYRALKPGGVCVTCEPGDGHAEAEASLRAVEQFGTTEKDMPPRHVIRIAREIGFRQGHAFPLLTANFLKDYDWSANHARPAPPRRKWWRPQTGILRLIFDGLVRLRLGVNGEELQKLRQLAAKWKRIQAQGDGYAVLVK